MVGQIAQSIVREFYGLVGHHLADRSPWVLSGPDHGSQWTANLEIRALPPLFAGGTFTSRHMQQVKLPWDRIDCCCKKLVCCCCSPKRALLLLLCCLFCSCLQHVAVAHVCERFLQNLTGSGLLSQGWKHWPATWMQEGGGSQWLDDLQGCMHMHLQHPVRPHYLLRLKRASSECL